jgi:membrane protein DedA with SNARE-associated domain
MLSSAALLVSKYGLLIVGAGTLIEGETVLLAAGALASRHVLSLVAIWFVGSVGAWLGHIVWFAVGRAVGRRRVVALVPRWQPSLDQADAWIRGRPWLCIFSLQYLYGMRLPGAVALGLSSLPFGWFLVAEALNCTIWAALVVTLGYAIGESAGQVLQWPVRALWLFVGVLIVSGLVYRVLHVRRSTA